MHSKTSVSSELVCQGPTGNEEEKRRRMNAEGDVLMQNHEEKEERRKREMDGIVTDIPDEKNGLDMPLPKAYQGNVDFYVTTIFNLCSSASLPS